MLTNSKRKMKGLVCFMRGVKADHIPASDCPYQMPARKCTFQQLRRAAGISLPICPLLIQLPGSDGNIRGSSGVLNRRKLFHV